MKALLAGSAAIATLAVAACTSSAPAPGRIEQARAAVRAATADPAVDQFARPELESAQDAFANVERSLRRGEGGRVAERWAGLAEQRAAAARETARQRSAEAQSRTIEVEPTQPAAPAAPPVAGGGASGAADASVRAGTVAATLGDDAFVADGFALKPSAEAALDQVVRLLQEDPARTARIDGHSDDVNSRSRSLEFSGRRADAVRGELVRRGIDASRIAVRALGDSFPIASNETALGRQRNRRVDIYITTAGPAPRPFP